MHSNKLFLIKWKERGKEMKKYITKCIRPKAHFIKEERDGLIIIHTIGCSTKIQARCIACNCPLQDKLNTITLRN